MTENHFKLEQDDADEFTLTVRVDEEFVSGELLDRKPTEVRFRLSTQEAVELYEAIEDGIGEYVREMRRERAAYDRASARVREDVLDPAGADARHAQELRDAGRGHLLGETGDA